MSVRPGAQPTGEPRPGCCSRVAEWLCEKGIAAVKRMRKRRERMRLREELDAENLIVKRNVVSTIDGTPIGKVTLRSGEVVDVTSILLFRPNFRERFRSIRIVSLRNGTSLVGNIEIVRGTFFPRPPLDVSASTSAGPKHCWDESVERAIRVVVKRGSF